MKPTIHFLQENFTGLFEARLLDEMAEVGVRKVIPVGEYLIRPGEYIRSVPILVRGAVKIMRPDGEGRETLLYYLKELDSCALSLTCCLSRKQSEITAVAEEETELVALPVEKIDEWMGRYTTWKQYVFRTYQQRFDDLLTTLDEVVFRKLDERLLTYLHRKTENCQCSVISITHEEIAQELTTSREVISRLLKQLEKMQKVKLMRNKIEMLKETV